MSEESGVKAGDGGFYVSVKESVDLKDGVISLLQRSSNEHEPCPPSAAHSNAISKIIELNIQFSLRRNGPFSTWALLGARSFT